VLAKLQLFQRGLIDGHAPSLKGHDLQAYCSAGIQSDHETSDLQEAEEKLRAGMMIMIREGTSAKNLEALVPLVNPKNSRRFCFVTDDLHPEDLLEKGHLDHVLRKGVRLGLDPLTALQMVTLHPAEHFRLRGRGAVAPGYRRTWWSWKTWRPFLQRGSTRTAAWWPWPGRSVISQKGRKRTSPRGRSASLRSAWGLSESAKRAPGPGSSK